MTDLTTILFNGAGMASVYGAGTLPEARGKGIGGAITLKPCWKHASWVIATPCCFRRKWAYTPMSALASAIAALGLTAIYGGMSNNHPGLSRQAFQARYFGEPQANSEQLEVDNLKVIGVWTGLRLF